MKKPVRHFGQFRKPYPTPTRTIDGKSKRRAAGGGCAEGYLSVSMAGAGRISGPQRVTTHLISYHS